MHKLVCILACIVFIAMVSCEPIRASASNEIDFAQMISDFKAEYMRRLKEAQNAINEDIINGNLDATSDLGKEYLKDFAIQQSYIYLPALAPVFEAADFALEGIPTDYFTEHPTIDISVSGGVGLYRTKSDGDIKTCTISTFTAQGNTGAFVYAPDFTFSYSAPDNYYTVCSEYSSTSSRIVYRVMSYKTEGDSAQRDLIGTGIGESTYAGQYGNYTSFYFSIQNESIPIITAVRPGYSNTSSPSLIGGNGQSFTLPEDTIESSEPWDYYNINILSVVRNIPDRYIIFPDGYTPTQPQDPTESSYPPGDLVLPPYGELVTEPSSYFVTDESGETVTDESGEPVTETTMIPVTVASSDDAVYRFRIPTLPNLQAPSEVPTFSASLPERVVGLSSALFRCVHDVLDASGVLGVMPFLIGIAVVIYVIYKIGVDFMLSILMFIASVIAFVGGIVYFVFEYAPVIADFWNNSFDFYYLVVGFFPDWLLPYLAIPLVIGIVGLLIKLL